MYIHSLSLFLNLAFSVLFFLCLKHHKLLMHWSKVSWRVWHKLPNFYGRKTPKYCWSVSGKMKRNGRFWLLLRNLYQNKRKTEKKSFANILQYLERKTSLLWEWLVNAIMLSCYHALFTILGVFSFFMSAFSGFIQQCFQCPLITQFNFVMCFHKTHYLSSGVVCRHKLKQT